jgi:hypothetical protein
VRSTKKAVSAIGNASSSAEEVVDPADCPAASALESSTGANAALQAASRAGQATEATG